MASKGLQRAIDNFTKGLAMGWGHQDRQADRAAKIAAAQFAAKKWSEQAELKRQELGINSRKADAYIGLSGAQAEYYKRKGAGGGGGGGAALSDNTYAWLNDHGGGSIDTSQPSQQRNIVVDQPPQAIPDPGGGGGTVTIDDKTGGKVPKQRFARGGNVGANAAAAWNSGFNRSQNAMARVRTPPINPAAPAPTAADIASSTPIERTSSVQTYSNGGMTGPGSGYGETAPPPRAAIQTRPMGFQQGGSVQRFEGGGTPNPGKPTLLSTMADIVGVYLPPVRALGRFGRDYSGTAPAPNTQASTPPPGQPHPQVAQGSREEAWQWAEGKQPGQPKPTIARQDRVGPMHDIPVPDYGPPPDFSAAPTPTSGDAFNFVMPQESNETGGTPGPQTAPARGGGGGGGVGGGGGWKRLGDQTRTAAYDPVKDRMDARNVGAVYEPGQAPAGVTGNVNPMVYAAKGEQGIQLGLPGQTVYRQGGRVQRFDGGGMPQRLPVPVSGREYGGGGGGGMPPQGGGEPADEGQQIADALTERWRQEAHAAADANQRASQTPMAPADQAGGAPQAQSSGAVPVPPLPERDPQWARDITASQPMLDLAATQGRNATGEGPPSPPPTYPDPREATGRPNQRYTPDRMEKPEGIEQQPPVDRAGAAGLNVGDPHPSGPPDSAGAAGLNVGDPHPPQRPGAAPTRPQAGPARPTAPPDTSGQDEADRLTREWNAKNQAGQPTLPGGVGPITKKGATAIDPKAPMAQGAPDPEGGTGLQGPGKNVGTGNATRDYLGATTTFADWALRDAGPQAKEQATAALYSGKGAGSTEQVGSMMMAVDPENKMPLDKRFEAAAKLAHDIHIANGNPKEAAESSFAIVQYGVMKSREHGAAAMKMLQQGDQQGALKELMAGYTWLADKGSASVKDNSIVITGDDGKVRAQIPLQEGTVQNLTMGMMSGQLAWDAIRRGSGTGEAGGGAPAQPPQGVNTTAPTAQAAQPSAAPAGPQPAPAAPAPAAPAQPQAVDTTPPQAKPAPAPQSVAPAPAPRSSSPPSSPTKPAGGGQTKPSAYPVLDLDKEAAATQARIDAREGKATEPGKPPASAMPETGKGASAPAKPPADKPDQKTETKSEAKGDDGDAKGEEKKLKEWHAKHPYDPPPGAIHRNKAATQDDAGIIKAALDKNQADFEQAVRNIDADAKARGISAKDFKTYRPKLIAELNKKFEHNRNRIEKERDRLIAKQEKAEDKERDKEPRKVTPEVEKDFASTFEARAKEIAEAKGSNARTTKEKKDALDRSVLRYQLDADRRRELDHLAKEIWRDNEHFDARKAFDTAVGVTEIHKGGGKGMNLQTGEKATSFRPIARHLNGGYVLLMPDGDEVTVSRNTYNKIQRMHEQNWRQGADTDKTAEVQDEKDAKAGKDVLKRAGGALLYFNPFTIGPKIGYDIANSGKKD